MARIAFVLGEDFEDSEFRKPYDALRKAGHDVDILGAEGGITVNGKKGREQVKLEASVEEKDPGSYDALVIPGGYSPDHLRTNEAMVDLVRDADEQGKTIAAVCHAGSLLIEADVVDGRKLTSWPSIRTDLLNAGAEWLDEPVVEDANLITSRNPGDLEEFSEAILAALAATERLSRGAPSDVDDVEDVERGLEAGEPSH
jgi:protease I